jgi:uncharacterized membrane protein
MTGSIDGQSSPEGAETIGRIIVAVFEERAEAEDAIRDLKSAGFSNEQIGVATHDRPTQQSSSSRDKQEPEDDLAEGAAAGALTGGVIGGLVGLISSLLIPGVGPLVVGGVLASSLLGMGVGAATGGLVGALVGMGVPEEDAKYFDEGLRGGKTLVTVNNTTEAPDEAISILQRHGGDLGPSLSRSIRPESYRGEERRSHADMAYTGPERRLLAI